MLPDFPSIKIELHSLINQRLRNRVKAGDPVLSMVRQSFQHEGKERRYRTVEGKEKQLDYKKVEAPFSLKREEIKTLSLESILKKVDDAAEKMSSHMARSMFATLEQTTKEAGTSIDQQGKPFTFETFLEALRAIHLDFNEETKKPHMPSLIMSPQLFEAIKDKLPEWEANEEYTKRYEEVIERKYQEWYDRESNRKLVD